jgi:hypothetical protein
VAISRKDRKKAKGGAAAAAPPCFALVIQLGAPLKKKKPGEVAEGDKAKGHFGKRARGGKTSGVSVRDMDHDDGPQPNPRPTIDFGNSNGPMPYIGAKRGGRMKTEGGPVDGINNDQMSGSAGGLPSGGLAGGGRLSAGERQRLPSSDFARPGKGDGPKGAGSGSYPIPDAKHARLALAMVSAHGSSAEKAAVRSKVASKYPDIGGE